MKKSQPVPAPQLHQKRGRNQFRAYMVFVLNQRGANLPADPKYTDLRAAVDKYLLGAP